MSKRSRRRQPKACRHYDIIIIAIGLSSVIQHQYYNVPCQLFSCNALKLTSLGSTLPHAGLESPVESNHAQKENGSNNDNDPNNNIPACPASSNNVCKTGYGVDRLFPIHHAHIAGTIDKDNNVADTTNGDKNPHGSLWDAKERQEFYNAYMDKCRDRMGVWGYLCDESEAARIESNLIQPSSMKNFTQLGFHKTRTPQKLHDLLSTFWWQNIDEACPPDSWEPASSSSFNHWEANTHTMDIDNADFRGAGGDRIRSRIWDDVQPLLEEWAGVELTPSALYGLRVFRNGALIPPHVDDLPFVMSVVIHVADEVKEPWVMEMIGHDGRSYSVTMEAGDMLFYEGHSVIHGNPFPMKGMFYSDVFVHFEPLGYTLQHEEEYVINNQMEELDLEKVYQRALSCARDAEKQPDKRRNEEMLLSTEIPHYIADVEKAKRWAQTHPRAKLKIDGKTTKLSAHIAAAMGDIDVLVALAAEDPDSLKKEDSNGWTPLHEAIRGGSLEAVMFLVNFGLDINHRTNGGTGGSPLWLAKKILGESHDNPNDVVLYLKIHGAKDIPPDD